MFVSDEERKKVLGFEHELRGMPSRSHEQMVRELKARAERFYEEASLEEMSQFTRMVEAIMQARGMLAVKGSSQIN